MPIRQGHGRAPHAHTTHIQTAVPELYIYTPLPEAAVIAFRQAFHFLYYSYYTELFETQQLHLL
jgi:hypothetical protein